MDNIWYQKKPNWLSLLLIPFSFVFSKIASRRKLKQQVIQYKSKIPVVVVGNISVGGTGKTPVVRKLAEEYLAKGKKPAIISRGYGAKADKYPFVVNKSILANVCGDEPAMLFDALNDIVPIVISPQRVDSVKYIEENFSGIDVIICDDGLQHYKLARDYEIVVVDATRMFGNKLCLPAGPLREPIKRLESVDQIVVIGEPKDSDLDELRKNNDNVVQAKVMATELVNLVSKEKISSNSFYGKSIEAVVGIGNPDKFFNTLDQLGVNIARRHIFRDHHKFVAEDFRNIDKSQVVIMTYKDAVKCKSFARENWWYLDIGLENSNLTIPFF